MRNNEDTGQVLLKTRQVIEKRLKQILQTKKPSPSLKKAMCYLTLQKAKRIRPIITMLVSRALNGNQKEALACACAVELIHSYTLIHDDLPSMDDDDFRRGKPSTHKVFGEAVAILAGNALQSLAFEIIPSKYSKTLAHYTGAEGILSGQILDLAGDKNILKVHRLKTASLFECASALGAMTAKASKKVINSFKKFGRFLGLAFQLTDDIIDHKTGKVEKVNAVRKWSQQRVLRLVSNFISKAKKEIEFLKQKGIYLKKITDMVLERVKNAKDSG